MVTNPLEPIGCVQVERPLRHHKIVLLGPSHHGLARPALIRDSLRDDWLTRWVLDLLKWRGWELHKLGALRCRVRHSHALLDRLCGHGPHPLRVESLDGSRHDGSDSCRVHRRAAGLGDRDRLECFGNRLTYRPARDRLLVGDSHMLVNGVLGEPLFYPRKLTDRASVFVGAGEWALQVNRVSKVRTHSGDSREAVEVQFNQLLLGHQVLARFPKVVPVTAYVGQAIGRNERLQPAPLLATHDLQRTHETNVFLFVPERVREFLPTLVLSVLGVHVGVSTDIWPKGNAAIGLLPILNAS